MVGDLIGLVVTDALISDDSKMIKLVTNKGYAFIAFTHETYVSKIDNASHIKSTIVDTGRISRFLHFVGTDLGMVMIRTSEPSEMLLLQGTINDQWKKFEDN